MSEQNWSNQTAEQLAKLSDQRLNEILKRARKANAQQLRSCRDDLHHALNTNTEATYDELNDMVSTIMNRKVLRDAADYFEMVKAECSKRPHFESKGE